MLYVVCFCIFSDKKKHGCEQKADIQFAFNHLIECLNGIEIEHYYVRVKQQQQ